MPISKLRPTFSFTEDRLAELRAVVPEAFADGKVNWDVLREMLGEHLEDEGTNAEHYGLSWPGKRQARRLAGKPSQGTLLPIPGEGINEATTNNIFIEGENLEVLKILQKSYAGRVKMIYIDPTYNRGSDLIYRDDYTEPLGAYLQRTGQADDAGQLLTTNTKADGRYHSNWLSMIYPRLLVSRSLLTDDGLLMVSISDIEVANLRRVLDEVFGEENFLATFIWVNEGNIDNQSRIKGNHEYVLVYAKDERNVAAPPVIDPNIPADSKLFRDFIENTIVKNGPANPVSSVVLPPGFPTNFEIGMIEPKSNYWPRLDVPVKVREFKTLNRVTASSGWSSSNLLDQFIANGFRPIVDSKGQQTTFYLTNTGAIIIKKERSDSQSHVLTVLNNMGSVQSASRLLADLGIQFDYPKPLELLEYLLQVGSSDDSLVLDFFAGSAGLGHAAMSLSAKGKGSRKFVMVQLPEPTDQTKLPTIAEIAKERLRRAVRVLEPKKGRQTVEGKAKQFDFGFKVYKLVRSNFKVWQDYQGTDTQQLELLFETSAQALVDDWKPADLLVEILLLEGFPLESVLKELGEHKKNKVLLVTSEACPHRLLICLDRKLKDDTLDRLQLEADDVLVCLDSALTDEAKVRLGDLGNLHVI